MTNHLIILVEERPLSDVYQQVKVTDEQFDAICKILGQTQEDFVVDTYEGRFTIEDVEED